MALAGGFKAEHLVSFSLTGGYDEGVMEEVNSMDLVIAEYKKHVDVSLLEENLKRTPEERIQAIEEFNEFREQVQSALRKHHDQVR
jgi:uncharacterized protein YcaQ